MFSRLGTYIAQHWRGELSLPVSYWVNGVGLTVALTVAILAIPTESLVSRTPRVFAVFALLRWVVIATITVWQVVGSWRAARRYLKQGSSRLWGNLARIAIVLGTVQTAIAFGNVAIPQIPEYARIAVGRDSIGTYNIRVLRDATEIEVSGSITHGLTQDVQRALDKHPTIRVIHLNSPGGRVGEARRLRDLIESRELTTYTASACESACTLAYAAGRKRLIAENARLGFHQYSFPGAKDTDFRTEYEKDRNDWLVRGFSKFFISKAFATPSSEMWRPSHEELFRWDVITGYPGRDDVAVTGMTHENVDDLLTANPMLLALKEHDGPAYAQIASKAKAGLKQGRSERELAEEVLRTAYPIVNQKLRNASNFALRRLAAVYRDEIYVLTGKPALCYAYVFVNDSERAVDATQHFSRDLVRRHYAALGEAVRSTSLGFQPPDGQHIAKVSSEINRELGRRHGRDLQLLQRQRQPIPEGKMCDIAYDLYEAILRLSEEDAGAMLRSLYS